MTSLGWKESGYPMRVLLLGVLLSHLGTYMVVPLLPIFLKLEKGMTIAEIGLILAMSPFTFQAGSLLGGWLADLMGRRSIIAIGAWINAAAIAGFGFFDQFWMFISMGLLSGLGVGLNAPSTKAAIAALASQEGDKTTAFSLRGIAANIGIAAAGLLTYFVLGGASILIFYVSAGLYILLGIISWLIFPKGCGDEPCKTVPFRSYVEIFKNKAFVVFSLVSILIWTLYTQLSLVGEGAGKFAGGQLLSLGTSSVTPWLTFTLGALVISGILASLRFWKPLNSSLAEIREEVGQTGKTRSLKRDPVFFVDERKRGLF